MKKVITFTVLLFVLMSVSAQVPQKMSYQAVIRSQSNAVLSDTRIGMKISIIQGADWINPIYAEYQEAKTNKNGLVTLQIGTGTILIGEFTKINWSNGPFYVKTETDPEGGTNYRITGSSELLSVPFAFFAMNVQNNNGQFVKISELNGTDSFDINLKGNISTSKNVTVAGNVEALGSTSTLGTIEKPFKGLFISSHSLSFASDSSGQNTLPTTLSNIGGNLRISIGGLKLMGANSAIIAPNFVGALSGNATSATKFETARNINGILFDGTSDITIPTTTINALSFTNNGTGDLPGGIFDGSQAKTISYNSIGASPSTGSALISTVGILSAGAIPYSLLAGTVPTWNQSTTGNAATVTTNANLTGVVTSNGNNTSIANAAITNDMLANAAIANLSGTNTGDQVLPTLNSLGAIAANVAIVAATKTKISYDAQGLIISGEEATTSDIAESSDKNYVTDTQQLLLTKTSGINTGDQILPTLSSLGAIAANVAIVGNTYTKISYDANGLVTSGSAASTSDIAESSDKKYVTDIQQNVLINTSGTNTGDQSTISGNAGSATKLASAKKINGIAFDGTTDITIATTSANALSFSNNGIGDVSGSSYDGGLPKTISYNSIGASPLAGSASLSTVGT